MEFMYRAVSNKQRIVSQYRIVYYYVSDVLLVSLVMIYCMFCKVSSIL